MNFADGGSITVNVSVLPAVIRYSTAFFLRDNTYLFRQLIVKSADDRLAFGQGKAAAEQVTTAFCTLYAEVCGVPARCGNSFGFACGHLRQLYRCD